MTFNECITYLYEYFIKNKEVNTRKVVTTKVELNSKIDLMQYSLMERTLEEQVKKLPLEKRIECYNEMDNITRLVLLDKVKVTEALDYLQDSIKQHTK
jgi:hypothetical protein